MPIIEIGGEPTPRRTVMTIAFEILLDKDEERRVVAAVERAINEVLKGGDSPRRLPPGTIIPMDDARG